MDESFDYQCPYCSSPNSEPIDITGGASQEWITDCQICCRPIMVQLKISDGQVESYSVRKENE